MKFLDGKVLAGYIKERHAKQTRDLRRSGIVPKLGIVKAKDDPAINTYVRLKKHYGADIGIEVEVHTPIQAEIPELIKQLNKDDKVHGIIIQLPLPDPSETDKIVNLVAASKDVDALGSQAEFEPATPMAILWLLAGYGIDLKGKQVLLIGRGKLVGEPLERILKDSGISAAVATKDTADLHKWAKEADVIIAAANEPEILTTEMIKPGAVVVDAGVAEEDGKTVGNLVEDVYERDDISVTPPKGGVGPLTVCALFENVIRAAGKDGPKS